MIVAISIWTKKINCVVANFLAAKRYLISIASGMATLGDITIIGNFESHRKAGFSIIWWGIMPVVINALIALSDGQPAAFVKQGANSLKFAIARV